MIFDVLLLFLFLLSSYRRACHLVSKCHSVVLLPSTIEMMCEPLLCCQYTNWISDKHIYFSQVPAWILSTLLTSQRGPVSIYLLCQCVTFLNRSYQILCIEIFCFLIFCGGGGHGDLPPMAECERKVWLLWNVCWQYDHK